MHVAGNRSWREVCARSRGSRRRSCLPPSAPSRTRGGSPAGSSRHGRAGRAAPPASPAAPACARQSPPAPSATAASSSGRSRRRQTARSLAPSLRSMPSCRARPCPRPRRSASPSCTELAILPLGHGGDQLHRIMVLRGQSWTRIDRVRRRAKRRIGVARALVGEGRLRRAGLRDGLGAGRSMRRRERRSPLARPSPAPRPRSPLRACRPRPARPAGRDRRSRPTQRLEALEAEAAPPIRKPAVSTAPKFSCVSTSPRRARAARPRCRCARRAPAIARREHRVQQPGARVVGREQRLARSPCHGRRRRRRSGIVDLSRHQAPFLGDHEGVRDGARCRARS